jgi:hypothetical protein
LETELSAERQRREDDNKAAQKAREELLRALVEAQTELRMLREGWRKPE